MRLHSIWTFGLPPPPHAGHNHDYQVNGGIFWRTKITSIGHLKMTVILFIYFFYLKVKGIGLAYKQHTS